MTAPKTRIGFYSGSFDPVTLGHEDIIRRALRLVDLLVIGIGVHPGKQPMFSIEERIEMLDEVTTPLVESLRARVKVITFDGLTVQAARRAKAQVILRGVRDGTDLDYEMQMSGMNGAMAPTIDTLFLPASPAVRHVTATLVRQIATMGGDVEPFVSAPVRARLQAKFKVATIKS